MTGFISPRANLPDRRGKATRGALRRRKAGEKLSLPDTRHAYQSMNASDPTHPSGENVTDASTTEQKILRETADAHLDSVADQLLRAYRESDDLEELRDRVDEASEELALVEEMLAKESGQDE